MTCVGNGQVGCDDWLRVWGGGNKPLAFGFSKLLLLENVHQLGMFHPFAGNESLLLKIQPQGGADAATGLINMAARQT